MTPGTVAHQVPLLMAFLSQEYWNRLPFSSAGYLLDLRIKYRSPVLQVDPLLSEPPGKLYKPKLMGFLFITELESHFLLFIKYDSGLIFIYTQSFR